MFNYLWLLKGDEFSRSTVTEGETTNRLLQLCIETDPDQITAGRI